MKSYKDFLLVSDMDGTLIGTDNKISKKNKKAIAAFIDAGGNFAIATGRTPSNSSQFMQGVTVNTPCIFYNGSMLYDWGKGILMEKCSLDGEIWRHFAAECLRVFPQACIEVYTEENCYIVSEPKYDDPRLVDEFHEYEHVELTEVLDRDWLKFFICAEQKVLREVTELAAKQGIDKVSTSFYSSPVYLEFVGKNVSKGDMLEVLRNLPVNKGRFVVAAGDFPNDNEMLRRADCGIAPANADAETKQFADRVAVSCDESLIDHIIYKIIPSYF